MLETWKMLKSNSKCWMDVLFDLFLLFIMYHLTFSDICEKEKGWSGPQMLYFRDEIKEILYHAHTLSLFMKFASKGSWVLIKNSHPGLVSPCAWDTGNFSGSGMNFDSFHASSETRWIPPLHPIPRWPAEWQAWTQAHTQTTKHVKTNVIRTGWTQEDCY